MWGSGIDLSAPDPGNELTVSRQMNRLDQIRIVVLYVPDARAHRPADHVVERLASIADDHRRGRNPRQSSMGFVPENQVRTRLPAGAKRIRTRGPTDPGCRSVSENARAAPALPAG